MKNTIALVVGVLMILTALFLAANTTTQDNARRPEEAVRLATVLHMSPTPLPTPTRTPIPGWTRFGSLAVGDLLPATELWLPADFVGGDMFTDQEHTLALLGKVGQVLPRMSLATRNAESGYLENGYASGMTMFFAANSATDYESAAKVRVVNLSRYNSRPVEFVTDDYFSQFESIEQWATVSVGRYPTSRLEMVGSASYYSKEVGPIRGASIRKLEYLVNAGDSSWVVIYTCKESDFPRYSPIFQHSIETFSVLPDS